MNKGYAIRLTLIVLAAMQSWNSVVECSSRSDNEDHFLNWLRTHSNNENALLDYTSHSLPSSSSSNIIHKPFAERKSTEILPELLRNLEQYTRYLILESNADNSNNGGHRNNINSYLSNSHQHSMINNNNDKRAYSKRNFWQPMGGPLPVSTRLVAFGSRLGPGEEGANGGSNNKAMRYGKRR